MPFDHVTVPLIEPEDTIEIVLLFDTDNVEDNSEGRSVAVDVLSGPLNKAVELFLRVDAFVEEFKGLFRTVKPTPTATKSPNPKACREVPLLLRTSLLRDEEPRITTSSACSLLLVALRTYHRAKSRSSRLGV